jgi:hypothetical protein
MSKGSTWNIWDFHLHTPYSVLNNVFGDSINEETWNKYIDKSDLYVGCLNAVVDPEKIKEVLESKSSIFRGKYLIVLAEENLSHYLRFP